MPRVSPRGWVAALALSGGALGCRAVLAGSVELNIPEQSTTSAGIYTEDGRLVRTLWSGRALPTGPFTVDWDGLNDDGTPAGTGHHVVKVLAHNVRYVWEGVIGNT